MKATNAVSGFVLALTLVCVARPAFTEPRAETRDGGTYLRFLNDHDDGEPRNAPPTLLMSFGGEPVRAVMDTGSTGIVVAASSIPNIDSLRQIEPGTLTYSSSGRIMRGRWVETGVTIAGANDQSITTRPMAVLAVERIDCVPHPRNCEPSDAPRHVAMLGVGFAREGDQQSQSTPDKNPFLNLPGMGTTSAPGTLRRGYVVTRAGVHVGLTAANTRGNYRLVLLQRAADGRDWAPLPACITVDDAEPACGTALIDTGVSVMYLTLPPETEEGRTQNAERGGRTLRPGTQLSIRFGDPGAHRPGYAFAAGDSANAAAPASITLVGGANRPTFVNTSVHALNAFDYLFDADAGTLGFRMIDR